MTDLRMQAYWYEFEPTGVKEIDLILCAIATAGKANHHTASWVDDSYKKYPDVEGGTPEEWIQNAANNAAESIRELDRQINRLKGGLY